MPLQQQHVDDFIRQLAAIEGLPDHDRQNVESVVKGQLRPLIGNPSSTLLTMRSLNGLILTFRQRSDLDGLHPTARQDLLDLLRTTAEQVAGSADDKSEEAATWLLKDGR